MMINTLNCAAVMPWGSMWVSMIRSLEQRGAPEQEAEMAIAGNRLEKCFIWTTN